MSQNQRSGKVETLQITGSSVMVPAPLTLPQRIYTTGAILKAVDGNLAAFLTVGDIVVKADTLEQRKVVGVVDNDTAMLDSAFSSDIEPNGPPITDGGQDLLVAQFGKYQSIRIEAATPADPYQINGVQRTSPTELSTESITGLGPIVVNPLSATLIATLIK